MSLFRVWKFHLITKLFVCIWTWQEPYIPAAAGQPAQTKLDRLLKWKLHLTSLCFDSWGKYARSGWQDVSCWVRPQRVRFKSNRRGMKSVEYREEIQSTPRSNSYLADWKPNSEIKSLILVKGLFLDALKVGVCVTYRGETAITAPAVSQVGLCFHLPSTQEN